MMTVQASRNVTKIDEIDLDAPIFGSQAFRLNDEQAGIITTARKLGQNVFAARAAAYDRDATFPTENYRDLHRAGLLGVAIPRKHGGLGADYQTYAIAAAEIGRYCGATALTWNMHVCSTLWSGPLADDLEMRWRYLFATILGRRRSRGRRRCVRHGGKTGQGGLACHWQEDFRFAFRLCRLLRRTLYRSCRR